MTSSAAREGERNGNDDSQKTLAVRHRRGRSAGTALGRTPRVGASGGKLVKYLEPLPVPGDGIVVATPTGSSGGATQYAFVQREITRQLHPQLPPTTFWAYDDGSGLAGQDGSFGLVLAAERGRPVEATFENRLPERFPSWIPVDTRLTPFHDDSVRPITHLHGGFVAGGDDGNPTITPGGFTYGQKQTVNYPNDQPAALLWFHDHALGATRLTVFAGLAAGYLIRDGYDTGDSTNANGLPYGEYEIPLVIQDRQFDDTTGELLYPTSPIPGVTWIGEYFGDVMLVNGKVWPYLDVEPRLYRFRVLNGCNGRFLSLDFGGAQVWRIGAEGGLFAAPIPIRELVLTPAERADLLVDFSRMAGQTMVLKNNPPRKPLVSPAGPLSQVMEIRVAKRAPVASSIPETLVGGSSPDLAFSGEQRFITLNESGMDTPDWKLTLNGGGFMGEDGEVSEENEVEDWCYVNLTGDTHPMHHHLFMSQVVGRRPFDVVRYVADAPATPFGSVGIDPSPYFTGPEEPPDSGERGWKDTVKVHPGQVTRIRARFDLPSAFAGTRQTYVHHCHIVEHEDNDMMASFTVD
jgi:spore coat protein A, manganese oxidase